MPVQQQLTMHFCCEPNIKNSYSRQISTLINASTIWTLPELLYATRSTKDADFILLFEKQQFKMKNILSNCFQSADYWFIPMLKNQTFTNVT